MENSQTLATESFSYSWLIDKTPPIPDNLFPTSSPEIEHNFKFDIPVTASQTSLVHADEIFSQGHLIPVHDDTSKPLPFYALTTIPTSPVSSQLISRTSFVNNKNQAIKWRKSSKRILNKCFKFACKTIGLSRKSNRVDDLQRKVFQVRTWNESPGESPRPSAAHSVVEWGDMMRIGRSVDLGHGLKRVNSWKSSLHASPNISPCRPSDVCCDADSIREAILYCKRTIGK